MVNHTEPYGFTWQAFTVITHNINYHFQHADRKSYSCCYVEHCTWGNSEVIGKMRSPYQFSDPCTLSCLATGPHPVMTRRHFGQQPLWHFFPCLRIDKFVSPNTNTSTPHKPCQQISVSRSTGKILVSMAVNDTQLFRYATF